MRRRRGAGRRRRRSDRRGHDPHARSQQGRSRSRLFDPWTTPTSLSLLMKSGAAAKRSEGPCPGAFRPYLVRMDPRRLRSVEQPLRGRATMGRIRFMVGLAGAAILLLGPAQTMAPSPGHRRRALRPQRRKRPCRRLSSWPPPW
jgi:hypothetical protein